MEYYDNNAAISAIQQQMHQIQQQKLFRGYFWLKVNFYVNFRQPCFSSKDSTLWCGTYII